MINKQALCFEKNQAYEEFNQSKLGLLPARFIPREICEKVESGFTQIIPYVIFYYVDFSEGKVNFFSYSRATTITEERLKNKISLGIGGHIDSVDDVVCDDIIVTAVPADGSAVSDVYNLTAENLRDTVVRTAKREALEELGNIAVIEKIAGSKESIVIFTTDESDVDKVHTCYMIPVQLTQEEMQSMLSNTEYNKEEVASISVLPLNFKFLLENFNFNSSLDEMMAELTEKFDMEDWSKASVYLVMNFVFNVFSKSITYTDLIKALIAKIEQAQSEKGEQPEETQATAEEPTGVPA